MNLEMVNLVKLQKLDEKISLLIKIEKEGPEKLAAVESGLQAAILKVDESRELEAGLHKRRRDLEGEVADADEKIKANQARQLQAKSNEEYRALLKEADYLRKANSAREDELLEIMEKLEGLKTENARLKDWLEEQRQTSEKQKQEIEDWMREGLKDKSTLDAERKGLAAEIPKAILRKYDRIYDTQNGLAVVSIVDGVCQHCFLQIPPQSYNELQRNAELQVCPNCNRIIYWAGHEDFSDIF